MLQRYKHIVGYLHWRPFDTSTELGRANERYRRALITMLANIISKLFSMVILLISVPLTLSYLGSDRFGIWMTISSLTTVLAFLDFGIGNGLLNKVAHVSAQGNHRNLSQLISNGLLLLLILGALIGILLLAAFNLLPWASIIKVQNPELIVEIKNSASTFALIFALSLPLVGVQRLFLGLQEGFLVHLISLGSGVISLIILLMMIPNHPSVPSLILITFGIQTVAPIILIPILFKRKLFRKSSVKQFKTEAASLGASGLLFFVLQFGALVAWGGDSIIVSSVLGAGQVAIMTIAQRLFQFVSQPLAMALNPLWAGYADAAARGDYIYIRKTLKHSIFISFIISLLGASVLLIFHRWLILKWTSGSVEVPVVLVIGYGVWTIFDAVGMAFAMFLNGLNILKPQLVVVSLFCLITLPLKIFLIQEIGLIGIISASLIGYVIAVIIPYLTFLRPLWIARLHPH